MILRFSLFRILKSFFNSGVITLELEFYGGGDASNLAEKCINNYIRDPKKTRDRCFKRLRRLFEEIKETPRRDWRDFLSDWRDSSKIPLLNRLFREIEDTLWQKHKVSLKRLLEEIKVSLQIDWGDSLKRLKSLFEEIEESFKRDQWNY